LNDRRSSHLTKLRSKILFGENEPIFSHLPINVLSNLRHRGSENAVLWNMIYPLAQPTISLKSLITLPPLWGTVHIDLEDDPLEPYFWGYSIEGKRLPGLDDVLRCIDGSGPRTEVDLFLIGKNNLLLVEAKHLGALGTCSRYSNQRCPELHPDEMQNVKPCRYWEPGDQEFQQLLDFGDRPNSGDTSLPCNRHYQLARTILVGNALAKLCERDFSMWMLVTKRKWRSTERTWLDFVGRIRDDVFWRRMRVIAWEELQKLDVS
jgi:hypothetical protein